MVSRNSTAELCLTTQRLVLRPVAIDDAPATAPLVTPDVAANLSTWPSPMSLEQVIDRIRKSEQARAERTAIDFAIIRRFDRELLGWIGLAVTAEQTARLGYWLGTEHRGRGLAREAAAVAVPAGAAFLGVRLIKAQVLTGNRASIALLEAIGFSLKDEEDVLMETRNRSERCLTYGAVFPSPGTAAD